MTPLNGRVQRHSKVLGFSNGMVLRGRRLQRREFIQGIAGSAIA
jgi:hypothetical protein